MRSFTRFINICVTLLVATALYAAYNLFGDLRHRDWENALGHMTILAVQAALLWSLRITRAVTGRMAPITHGSARIAMERQRQIVEEGFIPACDDGYKNGELEQAAFTLLCPDTIRYMNVPEWALNLRDKWDGNDLRRLEIAGAFIAAELDRRQRAGEVDA